MIQQGRCFGLLDEAALSLGISDRLWREDFDRDRSVKVGVPGLVDDAHSAFADLGIQPVMANRARH